MKLLVILLSFFIHLMSGVNTTIMDINSSGIFLEFNSDIKDGESAYIIRDFTYNQKVIINRCIVETNGSLQKLNCEGFNELYQPSLTNVQAKIKKGDRVVVGLLSKSAMIIAKDYNSYDEVSNLKIDYILLHPDLFALILYDDDNINPTRDDFRKFCKDNFIERLIFTFSDGLYEVDCFSFKTIKINPKFQTKTKKFKKPFYHRLEDIEAGFFDFSSEEIEDFDKYYKKLLK
jgi:hypothetical protein